MTTFNADKLRASPRSIDRNREREIPQEWPLNDVGECALCARPLLLSSDTVWIECIEGGFTLVPLGTSVDMQDSGYMGHFPVGPTCARKIPKRYHKRLP